MEPRRKRTEAEMVSYILSPGALLRNTGAERMDPKANLKEQLELASEIVDADEIVFNDVLPPETAQKALRLAELVLALDEWQRAGGFSPYA